MIRDLISSLHDRWANLHPIIRFGAVSVVGGLLVLAGAKPGYRAFREWKMGRNLVEAQHAVEETRMQEARDLSLTVLRSGDTNIAAFRILEKSAAALGDPRHGDIARALLAHPEGTDEDRLTGFLGVVMDMPLGVVGQTWVGLPEECRQKAEFALPFSQRLLDGMRLGEALGVLLAVPEKARDERVRQALARVLIASRKREGFEEAQRMIAAGVATGGGVSAWLDVLEEIPVPSLQENLLLPVRGLKTSSESADAARIALIHARIDYASHWPQRGQILEQAIHHWKTREPEHVARFLSHLGLHQRLLETYPAQGIGDYPGLLPWLLEAAETTGAWDSARLLLDTAGGRLPKHKELAHRALLAAKTGDTKNRGEAARAAIGEAKNDVSNRALLALHELATAHGLDDLATTAMVEAIRMGRGPLPLYEQQKSLSRSLAESGQDSTLLEICAIYLNFEPANPVLLTQYAYLACLLEVVEPAQLAPPLELLARAFPKELPIHMTLAATHLCGNQPDKAAEVLSPFELDGEKIQPGFRIIWLATQALAGKIPMNDPRIRDFPWSSLQVSERRKFSALLRNAPQTAQGPSTDADARE
jgi:hypothetical protein